MGVTGHKQKAPRKISLGIVTASTTRSLEDDESGLWIAAAAREAGHDVVYHRVIPDDATAIGDAVNKAMAAGSQVIIVTGGTGITPADVSVEAVSPLFTKELSAFGPLFAQLSYAQIGSAAVMSRAAAGVINGRAAVFCMPGSLKACQLACQALIFPELGHLVKHLGDT